MHLCVFVRTSDQTAIISLYNINWLVLVTESSFTGQYGGWNFSFFFYWRYNPLWVCTSILQPSSGAIASSLTRFLDHTQRRATVGRTPLNEWSVRRRDLLSDDTLHSQQTNIHALGQGRIKLFGAPRQWKHFRPLFQAVSLSGAGGITPQTESNTTPPSPKTEITNILFYISNFASIIKFKM